MPTANVFAFGLASSFKTVQMLMLLKKHGVQGFWHVHAIRLIEDSFGCTINCSSLWLSQTASSPGDAEMDFPISETADLL